MARLIIGLNAYAGAGKSAVAQRLIDEHGFVRVKFAKYLKAATRGLLQSIGFSDDIVDQMIEGALKEEYIQGLDTTPRELMQWLGEGARVRFGENFWVDKAVRDILAMPSDSRIVVDDLRYENELIAIKAVGGYAVRVDRPGVGPVNDHVSELSMPDDLMDGVLTNDAGLEELHKDADDIAFAFMDLLGEWTAA
ncbi:hypothetical protein [Sulfitobacter sp. 1A15106]|uniref:deoxynucleotide monophosphate kinase family protein n=1 Tax=Sulfitobacter sp. 1A15106 TaxID=3368590 RepID=UPI0037451ED0